MYDANKPSFPEGDELETQIRRRHRSGLVWRLLFQLATLAGLISLLALLYNITNQTFGLAAVENRISPDALVRSYLEEQLLAAATSSSEDDTELAARVSSDPNAVGFFGYAYYLQNQEKLRTLTVNGVAPGEVLEEEYPLARPLFLYTAPSVVSEKPEVAAFINYYLAHIDEALAQSGYFAADSEAWQASLEAWLAANDLAEIPAVDPAAFEGEISIAGSSTVYPLTQRVAEMFIDDGFRGEIDLSARGTTAGFRRFCVEGQADVVDASRTIHPAEFESCRAAQRRPLELRLGSDALAVVVSKDNGFAEAVTLEQLQALFTTAGNWAEVNEAWPNTPVARHIPGADSGTLDFFTEVVFPTELADLPHDALVGILQANISRGLGRRLEREQRFYENVLVFDSVDSYLEACRGPQAPTGCTAPARSQREVYRLVLEQVVEPNVVKTWSLVDSLFNREEVLASAHQEYPNAEIEFFTWLSPDFVSRPQNPEPEHAGVRTALLGSLWVIAITIVFSFPIGVGAAIYLEEYAEDNRVNRFIQTNINNLAGVPSIIYGILGLAIFVRLLVTLTSGALFGVVDEGTTANGRTILAAGLTLGLLILPLIIINAQEAIRAVPGSLRQASLAVGATKWQTVWSHVLPNALPGILTGTILAMSRAIGETAPLVVIGASTFITADPTGPFSKFTTLPIQIYQWTSRPQAEFRNIAGAAIIVLLALLLALNATAIILRNRFSKRLS